MKAQERGSTKGKNEKNHQRDAFAILLMKKIFLNGWGSVMAKGGIPCRVLKE